jgi:hypothetical protein
MKDQDERPSQYPEDGADDHGDYVDGEVIREEKVRQKEEDQADHGVTYERPHVPPFLASSIGFPQAQPIICIGREKGPGPDKESLVAPGQ